MRTISAGSRDGRYSGNQQRTSTADGSRRIATSDGSGLQKRKPGTALSLLEFTGMDPNRLEAR